MTRRFSGRRWWVARVWARMRRSVAVRQAAVCLTGARQLPCRRRPSCFSKVRTNSLLAPAAWSARACAHRRTDGRSGQTTASARCVACRASCSQRYGTAGGSAIRERIFMFSASQSARIHLCSSFCAARSTTVRVPPGRSALLTMPAARLVARLCLYAVLL
eukprot:2330866-Rhodomonas_salina.3